MGIFERVADLSVRIDDVSLERRARETQAGQTRVTTEVVLTGDGTVGRGEDVTYETAAHEAWTAAGPDDVVPAPGQYTVASFSEAIDDATLFPGYDLDRETYRSYRRWSLESAALDLGLNQADTHLGNVLDRPYRPVRFAVSPKLGSPPTADRVRAWLDIDPAMEFKVDAEPDWTATLASELAATDRVRVVDLKGLYEGTSVDTPADPALYELVTETFQTAVIEDARVTPETRPILESVADRLSWDAPIHGVADVEALPFEPRWLNIKPSRFGSVESLFATIECATTRGINLYGGGQFELGVGRDHIQAIASLFYPDGPNDVAPRGYNDPDPRPGLPTSPLTPDPEPAGLGFRR